jgi:hypothetical protein
MPRVISQKIPVNTLLARPNQKRATQEQIQFLDKFFRAARKIRVSGIIERINQKVSHIPTDRRRKRDVFDQLIIFLWLSVIKPAGFRISPSAPMDTAWHEFILFTKEYWQFCARVGYVIDHTPTTSENRTQVMAKPEWNINYRKVCCFVPPSYRIDIKYWNNPVTKFRQQRSMNRPQMEHPSIVRCVGASDGEYGGCT